MKGGIGQLMKQAQQMQADMKKAQEEMASITVTGESGAGMVRVTMTCQHRVQKVEIDDSMIGDDKEMLEDLTVAAFNDAVSKVEKTVQEKFSGMAGGLKRGPSGIGSQQPSPSVCSIISLPNVSSRTIPVFSPWIARTARKYLPAPARVLISASGYGSSYLGLTRVKVS